MPRKPRIFLVEDHPAMARALKEYLEGYGYKVDVALGVKSAVKFASSHRFDILVSDLHLGDGTGWDLMKRLRKLGRGIRGIAFSVLNAPEDHRRSKKAGFLEHILKTADPGMLVEAIQRAA
jgi:CheY-like chemotaxis protein